MYQLKWIECLFRTCALSFYYPCVILSFGNCQLSKIRNIDYGLFWHFCAWFHKTIYLISTHCYVTNTWAIYKIFFLIFSPSYYSWYFAFLYVLFLSSFIQLCVRYILFIIVITRKRKLLIQLRFCFYIATVVHQVEREWVKQLQKWV